MSPRYSTILKGHCQAGDVELGFEVLEQMRRESAVQNVVDDDDAEPPPPSPEEERNLEAIGVEKRVYKENFDKLRALKSEIEGIQRLLEKGRAKVQADFDRWYDIVLKRSPPSGKTPRDVVADHIPAPSRAWATPPAGASAPVFAAPQSRSPAEPKRLTGNRDADADIEAFYRAKEELAQLQAKR